MDFCGVFKDFKQGGSPFFHFSLLHTHGCFHSTKSTSLDQSRCQEGHQVVEGEALDLQMVESEIF